MRMKKVSSNFDSVIGKNTILKGDIECGGSIRVEGTVTGDIIVEGDIYLGKEGYVKGKVEAVNVHVSGMMEGNLKATGILRIMSSARLIGDVEVKSFVADEGAVFQGNCKMIDFEEEKPKAKTGRTKSKSSKSDAKEDDSIILEEL